jgi:hypothetical protein
MPKTGGTFTGDVIFDGSTAGRDITFDRSENALTFEDSAEIKLGTNDDLRIYHDGLNNYWKSSSATYIDYGQNDGVYIRGDHNGTGTYENTAILSEANMVFYSSGIERLRINNNAPGVEVQNGLSVDTGDIDIASGALEIGGSVAIPSSFGANGTVLTSNGTSASWQTPSGGSGSLTVQDEGTSLTTDASILNFTGNGVVASGTGSTKTIAINGQLSYDPNPQLGGNLNLLTYEVITSNNDDVIFNPGGSGQVVLKGNSTRGAGQFVLNCEQNTHGITIKGPPHSAGATYTLTLPDTDGNSSEFLQTDGSGNLSWATGTSYTHPNHSGEVTSTGDGATVIADDVVDEANLKVSNTPTDGYVLTARSGNTGGMTWEAASGGIALTDLSVTQNAASGSGTLSYDNTSGVFSYTPPVISGGGGSTASALTEQEFTATAGQTVFTVTGGITNADNVVVFLNGSRLFSTDVTISDTANTVTLAAGATVGDLVTVSEFGAAFGSQYSSSIFTVGTSSEYNTSSKVLTTPYTANRVAVYLNGVKLLIGTDCTATNGTTIDLTNVAPVTGDKIEVVEHGTLADTVTTLTGLTDTPSSLGTAGQILQVNSGATALEFADASSGSGVTSYANKTAIDAVSSPSEGDLAYDLAADQLYIRTTSAWKRVSIGVDESPVITTEPATTHTLNSDGSTSTVTMVATDPEGFGITYGIAYPAANNALPDQLATATSINQSTGVYTFDPSTTSSDAGTVKVRLSASDGISTTTRFCTLSLAFSEDITTPNTGIFNAAGTNSFDYTVGITNTSGMGFSSTLRTGKYYFELVVGSYSTSLSMFGLVDDTVTSAGYNTTGGVFLFANEGNKYPSNISTSLEAFNTTGDIVMFAYDTSTREIWVGVNGNWYQDPSTTSSSFLVGTSSTTAVKLAFGMGGGTGTRSSGTINVGSNVTYTVPTGFSAH